MKIGSLCTGYGGIESGLSLAGVAVDVRWVAELDPAVAALHAMPNLGDVTAVDWSTVERVDMITAGFPCQPTSSAGRQLGDADPRWLWPAVFRAVSILLPDHLLIENVRNLISWDKGRLWQGILDDLTSIGYDVRWLTLGACHVGAAHHRHRVFALATKAPILADHTAIRIPTTACGSTDLLPTPAARDGAKGGGDRTQAQQSRDRNSVTLDVVAALLPSPQARDGQGRGTPNEATATARFESGRRNLDDAMALLPTPRATDGVNGGPGQRGSSGDLAMSSAVQPEHWGRFGLAIERHAQRFGQPPAPTEPNRNGAPRLSSAFAEWLMCIPAGHVTSALPRNAALKAIGNGVCPPQIALAYQLLIGETPPMSKLSESEEIAKIKARAQAIAQTALDAYAGTPCDDETPPDTLAGILHGIAKMWREDAIALEGSTKRGSKGRQIELRAGAGLLSAVAVDVAKLVPSDDLTDVRTSSFELPGHGTVTMVSTPIGTIDLASAAAGIVPNQYTEAFLDESLRIVRDGVAQPLPRAVPGSFGPGDQRPDWAGPPDLGRAQPAIIDALTVTLQPTSVPGIDGTLIPALNIGEHVTTWPTPEQMSADIADGINPPPRYVVTVTDGDAPHDPGPNHWAHYVDSPSMAPDCFSGPSLNSLTTDAEKQLLAAAAAHQAQVKADAVAYISGATDVLPDTKAAPMQIFDPEHKPAAPTVQRLRFSDLLAIQGQLPDPQHKSHSQITALENCGVKHLLGRAARHGLAPAAQLQWAAVAGTAFHSTIEAIERAPQHPGEPDIGGAIWTATLEATIVAEERESGTSRTSWRVANSGLEGYDWWRVNGEQFVRAYVDFHNPEYREAKRTSIVQLGETRELAIEVPFRLEVEGIPVDGKIDQVWATWPEQGDPTFAISDLKAGKPPFDTFQLAIYGYALSQLWAIPTERISAAFWAARKGKYETAAIFDLHPWDEIVYRTHAAAQREQQMPAPRVSTFCHGCEHKLACPAGPRS